LGLVDCVEVDTNGVERTECSPFW